MKEKVGAAVWNTVGEKLATVGDVVGVAVSLVGAFVVGVEVTGVGDSVLAVSVQPIKILRLKECYRMHQSTRNDDTNIHKIT